jgi:hypothetical protein
MFIDKNVYGNNNKQLDDFIGLELAKLDFHVHPDTNRCVKIYLEYRIDSFEFFLVYMFRELGMDIMKRFFTNLSDYKIIELV